MDRQGVARIARYISVSQGREFTSDDLEVWADAISDLDADVALDAARYLVRESTAFITPASVRQRYAAIARQRLSDAEAPELPPDMSVEQYQKWLREYRRLIIAGDATTEANSKALHVAGVTPSQVREPVDLPMLGRSGVQALEDTDGDGIIEGEIVGTDAS